MPVLERGDARYNSKPLFLICYLTVVHSHRLYAALIRHVLLEEMLICSLSPTGATGQQEESILGTEPKSLRNNLFPAVQGNTFNVTP